MNMDFSQSSSVISKVILLKYSENNSALNLSLYFYSTAFQMEILYRLWDKMYLMHVGTFHVHAKHVISLLNYLNVKLSVF